MPGRTSRPMSNYHFLIKKNKNYIKNSPYTKTQRYTVTFSRLVLLTLVFKYCLMFQSIIVGYNQNKDGILRNSLFLPNRMFIGVCERWVGGSWHQGEFSFSL